MTVAGQTARKPSRVYLRRGHPLATGLVAAWPFFEGAGETLRDVSGRGWHGTINNATWVNASTGAALNFTDTGDDVDIDGGGPNHGSPVTFSALVRPTALQTGDNTEQNWILSNSSTDQIRLEHDNNGNWRVFIFDGSASTTYQATSSTATTTGPVVHLGATHDGETLTLFVNGSAEDATAASLSLDTSTPDVVIGNIFDTRDRNWIGEILDARIYNYALPGGAMRHLAENPLAGYIVKPR